MNLAARFFDALAADPAQPAIREANGAVVTRGELRRKTIGLQQVLVKRGFEPGDPVVIQAPNGATFAAATIAIAGLGGVSVLAEPGLGDEVYLKRIAAAEPKWAFVDPAVLWANRIPGARRFLAKREVLVPPLLPRDGSVRRLVISARSLSRSAAGTDANAIITETTARQDATVIFTGGTTSAPKGVRLSHDAVGKTLDNIAAIAAGIGATALLADTPLQVLFGLALGTKVLVTRGRARRRAEQVLDLIQRGTADAYFGSPFMWMEMMELAGPDRARLPASLKAVFLGGAPVTREFLTGLSEWLSPETKVTVIYGLTEAGPVASSTSEEKLAWTGDGDFVGRLMPGTAALIADDGEILLQGQTLLSGYVGQAEMSATHSFATGDIGNVVDHDGSKALVLLSRKKDMIIRAGVNIYPATLEADLRAIVDEAGARLLREAALIGLWDETKQDEVLVLCWQPMSGVTIEDGHFQRAVLTVTGESARPDFMMKCDPIPVTGRQSKVDKAALRSMASSRFGLGALPHRE